MQEIYTGLAAHFPTTVEELLEFRRDYAGTPEDAIREIHYRYIKAVYRYVANSVSDRNIAGSGP